MAEKYYWLKLKRDFFKRHDIRVVEGMPNGKDYILFYLKLLVESIDHEGLLRFSDTIPYNEEMLATITNTNIDIVRSAMEIFTQLGMIEVLEDKTIFMAEVNTMIGGETKWAEKKRIQRLKQGQIEDKVRTKKDNVRQEIEIEKEKELEIEKDINISSLRSDTSSDSKSDSDIIIALWNELDGLGNIKAIKRMDKNSNRYKNLQARLKTYTLDDFKEAIDNIRQSKFLQGENKNGWTISFEWFVLPNNFPKVLEGKYNDTTKQKDDLEDWQ